MNTEEAIKYFCDSVNKYFAKKGENNMENKYKETANKICNIMNGLIHFIRSELYEHCYSVCWSGTGINRYDIRKVTDTETNERPGIDDESEVFKNFIKKVEEKNGNPDYQKILEKKVYVFAYGDEIDNEYYNIATITYSGINRVKEMITLAIPNLDISKIFISLRDPASLGIDTIGIITTDNMRYDYICQTIRSWETRCDTKNAYGIAPATVLIDDRLLVGPYAAKLLQPEIQDILKLVFELNVDSVHISGDNFLNYVEKWDEQIQDRHRYPEYIPTFQNIVTNLNNKFKDYGISIQGFSVYMASTNYKEIEFYILCNKFTENTVNSYDYIVLFDIEGNYKRIDCYKNY